jgi:hypothetical protein
MNFKRKLNKTKTLLVTTYRAMHVGGFCGYLLPTIEVFWGQGIFYVDFVFWDRVFEIWVGPDQYT